MIRNKLFEYENCVIACLGDPHLGKKFKTGVPSNRAGERESLVLKDFRESLLDAREIDYHVCMGDLFDKSMVDYQTIFAAYHAYAEAADKFSRRTYFIIMGNHDMSRNVDKFSSFQMFAEMIRPFKNVIVVMKPIYSNGLGFIPYHPFKSSDEMIEDYKIEANNLPTLALFGHWDLDSFSSEMPHNILPIAKIAELGTGIDVYTGHIHNAEERDYPTDIHLEVVGSMQPYSHAEDPTSEFYVTLTMEQLYKVDPRTLKNMCIRVILKDGESLPDIDCLQLTGKREGDPEEDEEIDVEMVAFDMQSLMRDELQLAGVTDQKTLGYVFSEYDRLRAEE